MNVLVWLSIGLDRRTPSFHLIEEIINQLSKNRCNVTIVQKNSGGNFDYSFLKKYGCKFINVKCKNPKKNNLIYRYLIDLLYIRKCKKILKKSFCFDSVFIQSSNVAGIQTSIIRKYSKICKIVYNAQDLFPSNLHYLKKIRKSSLIYRILNHFQNKAYVNSNKIITISDDMKNELIKIGVDSKKIAVIYNWSYSDNVYENLKTENSIINSIFNANYFNVLYAGNIGIMQNVDIIIETAEILKNKDKNIKFIIIGDGVYKKKIIEMKENLKLSNVFFYDMMSSEYAPILYQRADVNIIPLRENIYKTALPSKTATCLACQKPIIFCLGKDSIFGKKIYKETKCPCINSNDSNELAEKILSIKSGKIKVSTKEYYLKFFSKTKNGKLYANIIMNTIK